MSKIVTGLSVSVDGYIAGPDDERGCPLGVGGRRLFEWYADGDTPSRLYPSFRLSADSAAFFDAFAGRSGAVVTGRRTYEIADGWAGNGPLPGKPLFVLTHHPPEPRFPEASYTYVTTGISDAIEQAREAARGQDVSLMGSAAVRQALTAGLLNEIILHQVPVLLGGGVRLLDEIAADLRCTGVVDAPGVTHLTYEVIH